MNKRIMSALLVSLASLGICTNANAMEKGKKMETGISNKMKQDNKAEPTWNGKPISQELRLVHLPGWNLTDGKKYWSEKWKLEANPLIRGKIEFEYGYVILADSKDQILGYCKYKPLDVDFYTAKTHDACVERWIPILGEKQLHQTYICDYTQIADCLRGKHVGLTMLKKAIETEDKNKNWVLYDVSAPTFKMRCSNMYSKLGFERVMENQNGVLIPKYRSSQKERYGTDMIRWASRPKRLEETKLNPKEKRHGAFDLLEKQNTLSNESLEIYNSLKFETLKEKETEKKYAEKLQKM